MMPKRMLGLDVGSRRTGVAVSEGGIAVPFTIIDDRSRNAVIARAVGIAREQEAAAIVVGLPVSLSGEEHAQAKRSRSFGAALTRALASEADGAGAGPAITVVYQDELMSTAEATDAGRATSSRARLTRARHADDLAAAVILQRYIDEHTERHAPGSAEAASADAAGRGGGRHRR